jgi:hypothetical protein
VITARYHVLRPSPSVRLVRRHRVSPLPSLHMWSSGKYCHILAKQNGRSGAARTICRLTGTCRHIGYTCVRWTQAKYASSPAGPLAAHPCERLPGQAIGLRQHRKARPVQAGLGCRLQQSAASCAVPGGYRVGARMDGTHHHLRLTTARQRGRGHWVTVRQQPPGPGPGRRLKARMDIARRAAAGPASAVLAVLAVSTPFQGESQARGEDGVRCPGARG